MGFDSFKLRCSSKVEKKAGSMQAALHVIGDKWSPLLLGQLVDSQKTFGELETALAGISPRTLSSRLEKMQEHDILKKTQYNDHPPRFKYSLTKKGTELQEVLQNMAAWGEKYS